MKFVNYLVLNLLLSGLFNHYVCLSSHIDQDNLDLPTRVKATPLLQHPAQSEMTLMLSGKLDCIELNTNGARTVRKRFALTPMVKNSYSKVYETLTANNNIIRPLHYRIIQNDLITGQNNTIETLSCKIIGTINHRTIYDIKHSCQEYTDIIFSTDTLIFAANYMNISVGKQNIILRPLENSKTYIKEIIITPKASPIFISGAVIFRTSEFIDFCVTNSDLKIVFNE